MKINAFDLSSVENAINKLKKHRNKVEKSLQSSIKDLTQKGYDFMISIVREDTGELKNGITWKFDETNQKGTIKVGADYAIFIEFGTGIIGKKSPHPEPKEGWKYDMNSHGMAGWWFFDERQNKFRWTRGQKSNAFVYKTAEFLRKEAKNGVKVRING